MTLPVVAIVGRPNVGKSTLFNRLVGQHKAAVHDRPGVTRDRMYEEAEALGKRYICLDTGGLEPRPETPLLEKMRLQTLVAVEEADVIVFVVDAQLGFTPADAEIANELRRVKTPVILAVNKVDGQRHDDLVADFWQLGLEDLFPISGAHGRGIYELVEKVLSFMPDAPDHWVDEVDSPIPEEQMIDPEDLEGDEIKGGTVDEIRIAVLGRPNIGKSTLVNKLIGEERHVVHDMPGTTMDPIDSAIEIDGQRFLLVDTAGLRRKSKIDDQLERFISLRSIKAIERCHVCLLMIDATEGVTTQDARLAQLIIDRGRALIVLINKWDLTKDDEDIHSQGVEEALLAQLPHAVWASHLFISAKTGKGVNRIMPMVLKSFTEFDKRVPSSRLNRFLEQALIGHSPPQKHNHPVRIYYCTQARVRPPTFVFFSNTPEGILPPYKRYLSNRLRETFGFDGTPLKLHFRKRRKSGEEKE